MEKFTGELNKIKLEYKTYKEKTIKSTLATRENWTCQASENLAAEMPNKTNNGAVPRTKNSIIKAP